MPRYINADEALRMMQHSKEDKPNYADWDIAHDCCIDCVNGATTADVEEVKHGEWIEGDWVEYDGHGECVHCPKAALCCSTCNHAFKKELLWTRNYCPYCGTKMDGGTQ